MHIHTPKMFFSSSQKVKYKEIPVVFIQISSSLKCKFIYYEQVQDSLSSITDMPKSTYRNTYYLIINYFDFIFLYNCIKNLS